jgi:hypothetical protein
MQVMQPGLAVAYQHEGINHIGFTGPQGFHLGTDQDDSGLQTLFNVVFVEGPFIYADEFLRHGL